MTLRAPFGKLIVQVQEEPEQTESGIYVPHDSILPNQLVTAISVGKNVPLARAGDTLLVSRYGGKDLPSEYGERLVSVEGKRVYAVIR